MRCPHHHARAFLRRAGVGSLVPVCLRPSFSPRHACNLFFYCNPIFLLLQLYRGHLTWLLFIPWRQRQECRASGTPSLVPRSPPVSVNSLLSHTHRSSRGTSRPSPFLPSPSKAPAISTPSHPSDGTCTRLARWDASVGDRRTAQVRPSSPKYLPHRPFPTAGRSRVTCGR